ncbi:hypothetical protein H0H92_013265 [Tricholoma furcatifolium]|nr:hypothetical protein H0H92_013265 [Tricholoma furcatifolium]
MAKAKATTTRPKGQSSLKSFFGGGKSKKEATDALDEAAPAEDSQHEDSDAEISDAPQVKKKGTKGTAPDSSDLPPIHEIPAIFADLVSQIPEIKKVAEHIAGRKLRVATMCSGTESPLLALELIQKSIFDQHGIRLEIEHVFSCEIEPFKQAYIERNFKPPLLFRDVCELGNDEAHTAYGALAPVPGDVDILIAGTSCVDYSNLNTQKQDIEANGESGRTFRGMMFWVNKHKPPLVILENVCSAPWDKVQKYFEDNNYSAAHQRVDTKQYYIPHTRTRGYLVAVNEEESNIPSVWTDLVKNKLKRPASSTLDAFLLPSDDPRIHQARQKLVQESYNALDRRTGRTDWSRCESRHQRARLEEALGAKRPLTSWDEGGFCKLPDFAWGDWGVAQVERVWDLMDISLLRSAKKGIDPSYKTQVWNLSQNVDRTIGSNKVGICPCLTPSMIPYITNRGGPMVGLEALSMQGLPVDKLLLTRETEDQLADLAGNAMSTTVVGSCILAALVSGRKLLKSGDDAQTYETKAGADEPEDNSMDVDEPIESSTTNAIVGEDQLVHKALDLSATRTIPFHKLLEDAEKSSRLCPCEGRLDITKRQLFRCIDCDTSSCKKCGGRPEHNPVVIDVISNPRLSPFDLAKELQSVLPMCISLCNVTQELLDGLKAESQVSIPDQRWREWSAAVLRASATELRFVETKRQEIWSAVYRSPDAMLELLLHPQQPEWRLYANPEDSEPANADIRRVLESPIGRLSVQGDLLSGSWEFALPYTTAVTLKVEGTGPLVDSWEARLGLAGEEFITKKVFSALRITVPDDKVLLFDRDISGTYDLFEKCGTANGALHKKRASKDESSLAPIFLILDPHRTDDSEDCFVFSISKRRYEYGESRPIISKLDPSWRQSPKLGEEDVECRIPLKWVATNIANLQAAAVTSASFGTPSKALEPSVSQDACCNASALLLCTVPLRGQAGSEWPRGEWKEIDKIHERSTFKSLAWLLERVRHVDESLIDWQEINTSDELSNCERCAPTAPEVLWTQTSKKTIPIENPVQAGEYERRLKRRPTPFLTELKLDEDNIGTVRVGVNIPSLIHRALSRLPSANRTEAAKFAWRINTNFSPRVTIDNPSFTLLSNKQDPEHTQPPSFKLDLRKEQLRSLDWMLRQESRKAPPFIEEEVSEAILSPLGWRAEGRAQRPVYIRGGVLADQVGYGKTAITLGLIDCSYASVEKETKALGDIPGKIPVKATLIIVPSHLTLQWKSEVIKFTGDSRFRVEVISNVSHLNALTIAKIKEADIIIVASSILKSSVYSENLSSLAGTDELPDKKEGGRQFNAQLDKVLASLKAQTELLKTEGAAAVVERMKVAREEADKAAAAAAALLQSKRLKGKSYREANEKLEAQNKVAKPSKTTDAKAQKSPKTTDANAQKSEKTTDANAQKSPKTNGANVQKHWPPTNKIVEVYIDTLPPGKSRTNGRASAPSSAPSSPPETELETEAAESTAESDGLQRKPAKKGSKKKKDPVSSDYEASSDEESDFSASDADESEEESEEEAVSSDEDEGEGKKRKASKTKGKSLKAIPRPKAAPKKAASTSESDVDMKVDTDASTDNDKKATKRKAVDDGKRPAKKHRTASDPWHLGSAEVQKKWTRMRSPPLEMFHFARKVVDEYTYLDGKIHALVTRMTAERNWVLSGTPPTHDFGALKTIAAFLSIHLGIDDDAEGQSAEVKKRRREQTGESTDIIIILETKISSTAVERFHSFREVHSLEWHANRNALGQRFLDQFVRQNVAEIDEIPWTEKIQNVILPAAERAIYLELEHHLHALDMTIKRGKKTESDRERRLNESLGDSKSAEEALLKRCSHFELETTNDNAMKACDLIVAERQKQLDKCKGDLLKSIKEGIKREKNLGYLGAESMFVEWIRVSRSEESVEDPEASEVVVKLLDEAGVDEAGIEKPKKGGKEVKLTEAIKAKAWDHREKTHEIRRLTKELVGRVRSLRYFVVVRDLQRQREKPPVVDCPNCGKTSLPMSEVAVLSSCGHMGCYDCVKSRAVGEECVYAGKGGCKAAARVLNVVKAETLGVDDPGRHGQEKHFGEKLEQVVHLIQFVFLSFESRHFGIDDFANDRFEVKKDERVLVFVQFPDLMKKVADAFTHNGIKFLQITGSAVQKSGNLDKFQNNSKERVLLLNVMDESASGANLTSANHAIFLSPLLAPSKEIYRACETQAVGRLVRFGQTKHVNVWRFLTTNTIDDEIYEKRRGEMAEMAAGSSLD